MGRCTGRIKPPIFSLLKVEAKALRPWKTYYLQTVSDNRISCMIRVESKGGHLEATCVILPVL